ncbi:X8 domain-containing protein [Tanacetum coccineum]
MWCVANGQASESKLQEVLDYLCARLDCKEILPIGSCYDRDTYMVHVSYVIDLGYHINGVCNCSYARFALTDPCERMTRNMRLNEEVILQGAWLDLSLAARLLRWNCFFYAFEDGNDTKAVFVFL